MRKMFSKNQIAVIAKNVVDNNEVLSKITYDEDLNHLELLSALVATSIMVESPYDIEFSEAESSLQDKLDEKSGKLYLHIVSISLPTGNEAYFNIISNDSNIYMDIDEHFLEKARSLFAKEVYIDSTSKSYPALNIYFQTIGNNLHFIAQYFDGTGTTAEIDEVLPSGAQVDDSVLSL